MKQLLVLDKDFEGGVVSLVKSPRIIERFSRNGKRRSEWFYKANRYFSGVFDSGRPWESLRVDLKPLENMFLNWREEYRYRFVHLKRENDLFIRCVSRFDRKYRFKLKSRLKNLENIPWDLKIELTLDPKKFWFLRSEFRFIGEAWHKLHSYLKWFFGEDFLYFYVLEFQRGGRPHLHILFSFDLPENYDLIEKMRLDKGVFNEFYENLKGIWGKYGGGWVWVKPISGRINMVSYVLKYVNKTIDFTNEENLMFSSLLFASNKRLFNMSHRLRSFLGVKMRVEPQGYEYVGTTLETDLEELLGGEVPNYVIVENLGEFAFKRVNFYSNIRYLWFKEGFFNETG
jgi:hypothetical protein